MRCMLRRAFFTSNGSPIFRRISRRMTRSFVFVLPLTANPSSFPSLILSVRSPAASIFMSSILARMKPSALYFSCTAETFFCSSRLFSTLPGSSVTSFSRSSVFSTVFPSIFTE